MKKYLAILKTSFLADLAYKVNFFFYFFRQTLQILISLLLWRTVFLEKLVFQGYSFQDLIYYFFILFFVQTFVDSDAAYNLSGLIKSGDLSNSLLWPLSFFWSFFSFHWGKKVYRLFYFLLGIIILAAVSTTGMNPLKIIIFAVILINAALLIFLYQFFLGSLSFWLVNISSTLWFLRQITDLAGGGWLPLDFFPKNLSAFARVLPFYLTVGFPIEFFQGKITAVLVLKNIFSQYFWIFILFFVVAFLWRKGVKEYEAVGK